MKLGSSFDLRETENRFLVLLLCGDILSIFFHLVHLVARKYLPQYPNYFLELFSNGVFSLAQDQGLAESYQYVKEFWIILLLTYIFVKKRNLLFLVFSLVFVYIFADDVMMIHEKLGTNLQTYIYYPQMFGLREQDLGELTVYAFFGLIFFIILAFAYYRASDELRMIGLKLFLLLFAFALFGGGVDIGDSIFRDYEQLTRVMRVLEDGGELIVMSFMCWYVFKTSNRMDEERILSS